MRFRVKLTVCVPGTHAPVQPAGLYWFFDLKRVTEAD